MSPLMIIVFIVACGAAYKAFKADDPRQQKLYGFIALVLGGVLYYLGHYVPTSG